MRITAWYCNTDFMQKASFCSPDEELTPVLGETHHEVPVSYNADAKTAEDAADIAFDLYNWASQGFIAPAIVNEWARKNKLHASMGVGDIVKAGNKHFICMGIGWQEVQV